MSNENRLFLKTELIRLIEEESAWEEAISTQRESIIFGIVRQLEEINPNPQPLSLENLPKIIGDWQVYYSIKRNHNIFGTQTISNRGKGIEIKIRRNTTLDNARIIYPYNSIVVEITAFEGWKTEVEGVWNVNNDNTALVKLKTFEFKLPQLFMLPELKIPLFDFLGTENLWKISYLDEDMLLGRDDSGTLFVFKKRL